MRLYHGSKSGLAGAIAPGSRDFDDVFRDKQLDVFQMQQCDNQGRLFESLDRRDIDAKAFIKAFMNSRAAGLDSTFDHLRATTEI